MAIIIDNITRISPTLAHVVYHATAGETTFYIWLNGKYVTSTTETSYDVTVSPSGMVVIDVEGDSATVPTFPSGIAVFQWDTEDSTVQYRVSKYVDAAWVLKQVLPVSAAPVMQYRTELLAEGETHTYKIEGVDASGEICTARSLSVKPVRYPDPANLTAEYLGAGAGNFRVSVRPSSAITGGFG